MSTSQTGLPRPSKGVALALVSIPLAFILLFGARGGVELAAMYTIAVIMVLAWVTMR